jgi:MoxR-like ATPase
VLVGASPRGSLALMLVSRALAAIAGRDFVTPEDVKAVAVPALAHRLSLTPQAWATGLAPQRVVDEVTARVPGPATARRA